jgi:Uma2 family endonuclease
MSAVVEPVRHKLSIDDFMRLGAAGILAEDARVELIEGDLIDMQPIGTGHMSVSIRLNRLLVLRAGDDAIVSVAHPMRLPPWSMPQPDFMLLRPRADDYATQHPGAGDVLLAVEVADTSLRYDRVTKARVYASHGVAEYWIVEVEARRLHVLRSPVPGEGAFASTQTLDAPFTIAPLALPRLQLSSRELWPDRPGSAEATAGGSVRT